MKQGQTSIKNIPRLLEAAAKKHNERKHDSVGISFGSCFYPGRSDTMSNLDEKVIGDARKRSPERRLF